jgi:hypothetical protein
MDFTEGLDLAIFFRGGKELAGTVADYPHQVGMICTMSNIRGFFDNAGADMRPARAVLTYLRKSPRHSLMMQWGRTPATIQGVTSITEPVACSQAAAITPSNIQHGDRASYVR